nr:hypothetical protein [uncultured Fluviicola sp.]
MDTIDIINMVLVIISIIISLVAILLPLRKISKLTSRLVDFQFDQTSQKIILTYLIGNTGNVEWYLKEVLLMVYSDSAKKTTKLHIQTDNIPRIIEPNRVNLVSLSSQEIQFTTAEFGSELARRSGINQDFQIYVQFDLLNPNGSSIIYRAAIKGLLKDKDRTGAYWQTVDLSKIDELSSDYHLVLKK